MSSRGPLLTVPYLVLYRLGLHTEFWGFFFVWLGLLCLFFSSLSGYGLVSWLAKVNFSLHLLQYENPSIF